MLLFMDFMEFSLSLVGGDTDRAGAIVGSWRWLFNNRKRIVSVGVSGKATRILSDAETTSSAGRRRLTPDAILLHIATRRSGPGEGILPEPDAEQQNEVDNLAGVAWRVFSEEEEFDEIPESGVLELRKPPVTGPNVLSRPGGLRVGGRGALVDWFAQPLRDATFRSLTPRAARFVVVDVAPLLRVMVRPMASGSGSSGHAGVTGVLGFCGHLRGGAEWASCRGLALVGAVPVGAGGGRGATLCAGASRIARESSRRSPTSPSARR